MVGAALICVARTHTIAIRKFICQLECDAYLHDQKLRAKLYNRGSRESRDSLKSKNIFRHIQRTFWDLIYLGITKTSRGMRGKVSAFVIFSPEIICYVGL